MQHSYNDLQVIQALREEITQLRKKFGLGQIECNHRVLYWRAMPYDVNKGGAYYRRFCFICGADLEAERFCPGIDTPFLREEEREEGEEGEII